MRLLPKSQDWTAYAWLVYLAYFALLPFIVPSAAWEKQATVAATLIGLVMYFRGYWLPGKTVLWVVGGFVLLGAVTVPWNPAASVFFVYGASFLGKAFEPPVAYRFLAAILAVIAVETIALHLVPYAWVPAVVFTLLVGSVIIQQYQKKRLTDRLLMAQEQAQYLAKVAERERIARDLHDLLGHTLSVIILKAELASRLAATDAERAASEIRDVERISRDALAQVRSAVRGYRSAGIASELAEARKALETAGITVETAIEPAQLSSAQEGVLAMALREAVTNVLRHARATACRLSLRQCGAFCELEVADNGKGGAIEEGSGIAGMRERVTELGGVLERDGSAGTLLRIRVPV